MSDWRVPVITTTRRRWGRDLAAAAVVAVRCVDDWVTARLGWPPLWWWAPRAVARMRIRWRLARYGPPADGPALDGTVIATGNTTAGRTRR